MPREIIIDIAANGDVTVDGGDSLGPECERLTAGIEAALGVVEKKVRKPSYNRPTPVLRQA